MAELFSSLITPEVRAILIIILIFIILLYIMSILWVVRDSYLRGASPVIWGIVAVIPFLGCMIYAMMRPPLYASDREEQNIGLLLQQRELMAYGECPQCGYPTERDYIVCPNCRTTLKQTCLACGRPLEPGWTICPYCAGKGASAHPHSVPRASSRQIAQSAVRSTSASHAVPAMPVRSGASSHAAPVTKPAPSAPMRKVATRPAAGSSSRPAAASNSRPVAGSSSSRPAAASNPRPTAASSSRPAAAPSSRPSSASSTSARPAADATSRHSATHNGSATPPKV